MALTAVTPSDWDIFESGEVDRSTARRDTAVFGSSDLPNSATWGATTNINYPVTAGSVCAFYCDGYFQKTIQLSTVSGSMTAFAAGDQVALAPDYVANFLYAADFKWGSELVEPPTTPYNATARIRTWINYSKDYSFFNLGYEDLVLLDEPGQTQSFTTNALIGTSRYSLTSLANVAATGVPIPLASQSMSGDTGAPALAFTSALLQVAGSLAIDMAALSIALDVGGINFWKRQALTNAGKVVQLRLPLRRIFDFFAGYDKFLYGLPGNIRLTTNFVASNNSLCAGHLAGTTTGAAGAAITAAYIWVLDMKLCIPVKTPTPELARSLTEKLSGSSSAAFEWQRLVTQPLQSWTVGAESNPTYIATVACPDDPIDFVCIHGQPNNYEGSLVFNSYCSILPASTFAANNATNTSKRWQQAYITINSKQYPTLPYGSYDSDYGGQQWDTWLELIGRKESELIAGLLTRPQYDQNCQVIPFDVRGLEGSTMQAGSTMQVKIVGAAAAAAAFQTTYSMYATYVTRVKSKFTAMNGAMVYSKIQGGDRSEPRF